MIYHFFYFKCAISFNGNCSIICRKTKVWILNITFLPTSLYRITTRRTKSLFLHKNLTRKSIKYLLRLRYKPNVGKTADTLTLKKKADRLLILAKVYFFRKSKLYKSKFAKTWTSYKKLSIIFYKNALKFF